MIRSRVGRGAMVAVMLGWLGGCATYPLGMGKAEWEDLTPEQRLEARQEQASLDRARAERRAAEARAIQGQRDALQQARRAAGANAGRGERVQCLLTGELRAGGGWQPAAPTVVDLVVGWTDTLFIPTRDGVFSHEVFGSFDGITATLCPTALDMQYQTGDCLQVTAPPRAFLDGVAATGEIRRAWRGRMECRLAL